MRDYELVLVMNSSLSADIRKKTLGTIKEWLGDVKIVKETEIGQKALAYPIKREKIGYYISLEISGEKIPEGFEKRIINTEQVLRHLLIRIK